MRYIAGIGLLLKNLGNISKYYVLIGVIIKWANMQTVLKVMKYLNNL